MDQITLHWENIGWDGWGRKQKTRSEERAGEKPSGFPGGPLFAAGDANPLPKERWLDRVRLDILQQIGLAYAWVAPWAVGAGVLALLGSVAVAARRRRLPFFVLAGAGILASVCSMVAICGVIDATSFHAADVGYLTGCYGLVLLFVFFGWLALAEALRQDPR